MCAIVTIYISCIYRYIVTAHKEQLSFHTLVISPNAGLLFCMGSAMLSPCLLNPLMCNLESW